MLKKIGNNKMQGDGYVLDLFSHYKWRYCEGEKCLTVPVEILTGATNWEVAVSKIKQWEAPSEKEIISQQKKEEIVDNICDCLNFIGETYELA